MRGNRSLEIRQHTDHRALVVIARDSRLPVGIQRRIIRLDAVQAIKQEHRVVLVTGRKSRPYAGNQVFGVKLGMKERLSLRITGSFQVETLPVIRKDAFVIENIGADTVLEPQIGIVTYARQRAEIPSVLDDLILPCPSRRNRKQQRRSQKPIMMSHAFLLLSILPRYTTYFWKRNSVTRFSTMFSPVTRYSFHPAVSAR